MMAHGPRDDFDEGGDPPDPEPPDFVRCRWCSTLYVPEESVARTPDDFCTPACEDSLRRTVERLASNVRVQIALAVQGGELRHDVALEAAMLDARVLYHLLTAARPWEAPGGSNGQ